MPDSKFIKAYCKKKRKYYGIELRQFGSTYKAVNFIELSDKEAQLMTSEVSQSSFVTNSNLLACPKCGNRTIGGCSCVNCKAGNGYNFQCIYCKDLEIDYSSSSSISGYKEGDIIRLSQGQEVKLTFAGKPLKEMLVGVGWDPADGINDMDVDSSVIMLGSEYTDVVYFGNKEGPNRCIIHHGDNLTGNDSDTSGQDDENIDVSFDKVPSDYDKLVFVINIYQCKARRQKLKSINNLYIKLYDKKTKKVLVQYDVLKNYGSSTAFIIGMAEKKSGNIWNFKAIGQPSNAIDIDELMDECESLY